MTHLLGNNLAIRFFRQEHIVVNRAIITERQLPKKGIRIKPRRRPFVPPIPTFSLVPPSAKGVLSTFDRYTPQLI